MKKVMKTERDNCSLHELEDLIGYKFKDINLLKIALTHSSYSNESGGKLHNYERLEFLGDSVLGLVTSNYIFRNFPSMPEGDLTKLRASLVCEKQLFEFSKNLKLYKFIKLSRGERHGGSAVRASIMADVFESICAAIYIDSDFEHVQEFVLKYIVPVINHPSKIASKDYKTHLQEIVQKNPEETIEYVLTGESGPDHDKRFMVEVRIDNNSVGHGIGRSKKEAEQQAAKEALALLGF